MITLYLCRMLAGLLVSAGTLVSCSVQVGQRVEAGQQLAVVEAMKMQVGDD